MVQAVSRLEKERPLHARRWGYIRDPPPLLESKGDTMSKKLLKPVEDCPICGKPLTYSGGGMWWHCLANKRSHLFAGPEMDIYGRKVDRLIRWSRNRKGVS